MHRIKHEFLSIFFEKLQFVKSYCPTIVKQVEHYAEQLPDDYRTTMRQHNTLSTTMHEALKVEVDLAILGRVFAMIEEKRECEGSFESSRTKECHQEKKDGRLNFCMRCHSSHNWVV